MFSLEKIRLPYRQDSAFSCLSFLVFIVPLAFFLLTNENYETAKFSLFLILTGCALWAFLKKPAPGQSLVKVGRPVFYLAVSLGTFLVLSVIFSRDVIYSIFGFYYRFTDGLVFYLCLAVFVFLLINTLDRGRLIFLLKILVFDALIVAVLACLQAFGVAYYAGVSSSGLMLGPSLLGNPDFSAMFLAAVLPFGLVFLTGAQKFSAKIYYSFCTFISVLGSLVFASRGALLAIAISLTLALLGLLLCRLPKKFFFGLLFLFLAGGLFGRWVLQTTRPNAISAVVQSADSNTVDRIVVWEVSVKGILQHPLLGSGPGTFAVFFEHSRPQSQAGEVGVFDDPHNLFLRMAVTEGLPFVLLFLGLIAAAAFGGIRRLRRDGDLLTLGSLVSLAAWCVGVSFNPAPVPMFVLFGVVISGLLTNFIHSQGSIFKQGYKWPVYPAPSNTNNSSTTAAVGLKKSVNIPVNFAGRRGVYVLAGVLIICGLSLTASEYVFGFAKRDYLDENYSGAYRLSIIAERINPTNQLYDIYRIGGEIGMGQNPAEVSADINRMAKVHSERAGTHAAASGLFNLLAQKTQNKIYLQNAIAEMDKSLTTDKYYGERYGQEALYYYELGDYASAKTAVIKNLSVADTGFAPWVLLARLYQIEGKRDQAIAALTNAFKLQPDIPQLEYILYLAKTQKNIQSVPIQIVARSSSLD